MKDHISSDWTPEQLFTPGTDGMWMDEHGVVRRYLLGALVSTETLKLETPERKIVLNHPITGDDLENAESWVKDQP